MKKNQYETVRKHAAETGLKKDWMSLSTRRAYWQGGPWKALALLRTR